MDIFETENSVLSEENLHDGVEFITEFSVELGKYANRITGTDNETACARTIRRRLADETGEKVRLEAYKAHPFLGRCTVSFYGLWYLFCYVLYFVSFAGSYLTGILLTLLALSVFGAGCIGMSILYFGKRRMHGFLSQRVSYNVVSETVSYTKPPEKERVIIIADNHDAEAGSFFKDSKHMSRLAHIFVPLTALVFLVFCVLKMILGTQNPTYVTVLSVIPSVLGVMGISATILRFSPFEKHAIQNNGIATSVAMATYAYFAEQHELLPKDVRLVYVSFGGENSGHGGSAAFIKSHPEFSGAQVLCIGNIESGDLKIAERNDMRRIDYSTPMVSVIRSAAHEQKIEISSIPHDKLSQKMKSIHGFISDEFALANFPTATIVSESKDGSSPLFNDVEKLFSVTVDTVIKLMNEAPVTKDDEEEDVTSGSDMIIQSAVGK